jgi:alpha-beta hydrolase superfamily lysophospholipase
MDRVVLLHGLGRTWRSMRPVARALDRAGFETFNIGYPSRSRRLGDLAAIVRSRIAAALAAAPAGGGADAGSCLHFVGHSLGCILIRWIVAHDRPPGLGRIVLLTPPNRGSLMADRTEPWLAWLLRPLPDLTVRGGVAAAIPTPPGVDIGIIAGAHDRTVRLDETRLAGETDRAVVRSGHSFIMMNRAAQQMTIRFLRTGRFAAG